MYEALRQFKTGIEQTYIQATHSLSAAQGMTLRNLAFDRSTTYGARFAITDMSGRGTTNLKVFDMRTGQVSHSIKCPLSNEFYRTVGIYANVVAAYTPTGVYEHMYHLWDLSMFCFVV